MLTLSDRQSPGVGEAGRSSRVVSEPLELGVQWGALCRDLATLLFVEEADLKNVLRGLFFRATLALCCVCESFFFFFFFCLFVFLSHRVLYGGGRLWFVPVVPVC